MLPLSQKRLSRKINIIKYSCKLIFIGIKPFHACKYKTYVRSCAIVLLQTVYDSWGLLSPCMHGSIIYFTYVYSVLCNYIYTAAYFRSETKVYTITTGIPTFVVCQRHTVKALIHTRQSVCRVVHTAGTGKEGLCRGSFFEHSAKSLPCVKLGKKFQNKKIVTAAARQ